MSRFFSSIKLEEGVGHDRIGFWPTGAKNGELVVTKGTGRTLVELIRKYADKVYLENEKGVTEIQEDFLL